MPPDMPDEQKDEIAAKHPDDLSWPPRKRGRYGRTRCRGRSGRYEGADGEQSVSYSNGGLHESAMERARVSVSLGEQRAERGWGYRCAWNRPTRYTATRTPPWATRLPGGDRGALHVTTADVELTNGPAPEPNEPADAEDANQVIVAELATKADQDHVHADDGATVTWTTTRRRTPAAHNTSSRT